MGRHSCCNKQNLKKGFWSPEEDDKLFNHITTCGIGCWSSVPKQAGLQRCGKSCRLRWLNYLRPNVKRGSFTLQEEDLIVSLHQFLGNRWSKIASQLPGRTDNDIKNFWNSSLRKRLRRLGIDPTTHRPLTMVEGPQEKTICDPFPSLDPHTGVAWTGVNLRHGQLQQNLVPSSYQNQLPVAPGFELAAVASAGWFGPAAVTGEWDSHGNGESSSSGHQWSGDVGLQAKNVVMENGGFEWNAKKELDSLLVPTLIEAASTCDQLEECFDLYRAQLECLQRCGKSCRLRWLNYLRPDLKRDSFTLQEEDLIVYLHQLLGNRWSKIASQLPGRTDNEIKNFWNSNLSKRLRRIVIDPTTHMPLTAVEETQGKTICDPFPSLDPHTGAAWTGVNLCHDQLQQNLVPSDQTQLPVAPGFELAAVPSAGWFGPAAVTGEWDSHGNGESSSSGHKWSGDVEVQAKNVVMENGGFEWGLVPRWIDEAEECFDLY